MFVEKSGTMGTTRRSFHVFLLYRPTDIQYELFMVLRTAGSFAHFIFVSPCCEFGQEMNHVSHVLMDVPQRERTARQRPCSQDAGSLLHQLDNIFILHHVVLAHFLRVVFDRRAPDQSAEKGGVVK